MCCDGKTSDQRSAGLDPATNLLCDFEHVAFPLWTSVSSAINWGDRQLTFLEFLLPTQQLCGIIAFIIPTL